MRINRFIAIGAISGIFVGILVSFAFPNLLAIGMDFNFLSNKASGAYYNYSPKSGSVLNSFMIIPLLLGVLGGVMGLMVSKFSKNK